MTPEQKSLVKSSWAKVVPIADTAAELFYARLFEIDPATKHLFDTSDMTEQRRKLMAAISIVVQGLDHFERLVPTIEELGRRHIGYGVADEHYASVGAALLSALEKGLGSAWNPDVKEAWTVAYGVIADTMRHAAAGVAP